MRKLLASFMALITAMTPVFAETFEIEVNPLIPTNEEPSVYMIDRMLTVDGVNPYTFRDGQYAFSGEKLNYNVLVRDLNGVDDIVSVVWDVSGYSPQTPCTPITLTQAGGKAYVEAQTNLEYDSSTDKTYKCLLTVESMWEGISDVSVIAEDMSENTGSTVFETFNFNPPLVVDVETSDGEPITFGEADCDTRTALSMNSIRITNIGDPVNLWVYFAGSDFYSDGIAKCPISNVMTIDNFKYRAIAGTQDSGWVTTPKYNVNAPCDINTCYNANRIPTSLAWDTLEPNNFIDVNLAVTFPTPCTGTFDNGNFYAIVRAV